MYNLQKKYPPPPIINDKSRAVKENNSGPDTVQTCKVPVSHGVVLCRGQLYSPSFLLLYLVCSRNVMYDPFRSEWVIHDTTYFYIPLDTSLNPVKMPKNAKIYLIFGPRNKVLVWYDLEAS